MSYKVSTSQLPKDLLKFVYNLYRLEYEKYGPQWQNATNDKELQKLHNSSLEGLRGSGDDTLEDDFTLILEKKMFQVWSGIFNREHWYSVADKKIYIRFPSDTFHNGTTTFGDAMPYKKWFRYIEKATGYKYKQLNEDIKFVSETFMEKYNA